MRISDDIVSKLLERNGVATKEQLAPLIEEGVNSERMLQDVVIEGKLISESDLTRLFAEYANIPYIEVDPKSIPSDIIAHIPERIARQYNAVIFKIDEDGVAHIAMDVPDDIQAVNFLQ